MTDVEEAGWMGWKKIKKHTDSAPIPTSTVGCVEGVGTLLLYCEVRGGDLTFCCM